MVNLRKMQKFLLFIVLLAGVCAASLSAEVFRFQHNEGDQYRILSTLDQRVFVNGVYNHSADMLYKIAVNIERTREDGSGMLNSLFQISHKAFDGSQVYRWAEEYPSKLWRDKRGKVEIEPRYFMPVVRSVPTFPQEDIEKGFQWTAPGEEVQDFREFGLEEPFRIPLEVQYEYLGERERDGKTCDAFAVLYKVQHESEQRPVRSDMYPVAVRGTSYQTFYFDNEAGLPCAFEEDYSFLYSFNTGDVIQYEGSVDARVVESKTLDREKVEEEIREELKRKGVKDTDVSSSEDGVTIRLKNIQFMPDSANLYDSEIEKLNHISKILESYPERDILVTGHTALAGTEQGRQRLSEERAAAVAEYLIRRGGLRPDQVTTRGMGARKPIAPNDSEINMRKNRRVEIMILEN
ncbi:MAG: OmpA family protein [Spirochaetales bacterium]|nr:OmpA family protein [Spirochaetales bacterium]MCF7938137.1 OmpA family protein [Spirochaetales bacterium]